MLVGLAIAAVMAMVCVFVHAEVLALVERYCLRIRGLRASLLAIWGMLLSAHIFEVWLYALAYWFGVSMQIGQLPGAEVWLDYVYFSSVVYTTLGFGDIVPTGGLRMVAGSQALVGLCLIAWSATATYAHVNSRRRG